MMTMDAIELLSCLEPKQILCAFKVGTLPAQNSPIHSIVLILIYCYYNISLGDPRPAQDGLPFSLCIFQQFCQNKLLKIKTS